MLHGPLPHSTDVFEKHLKSIGYPKAKDNKEQKFIGRTNYLLSCIYANLLRLEEFNKDNDNIKDTVLLVLKDECTN